MFIWFSMVTCFAEVVENGVIEKEVGVNQVKLYVVMHQNECFDSDSCLFLQGIRVKFGWWRLQWAFLLEHQQI